MSYPWRNDKICLSTKFSRFAYIAQDGRFMRVQIGEGYFLSITSYYAALWDMADDDDMSGENIKILSAFHADLSAQTHTV